MENASKALIMAASVLLGVMIISVGVTLFKTFSDFSSDAVNKMQEKQISEWNSTYLKYYGNKTYFDSETKKTVTEPIKVTAHDIISVINSARQNNINYFGNNINNWPTNPNEKYNYVKVSVAGITGGTNAERWNDNEKLEFLKKNSLDENNETIYFKCTETKISQVTKRVWNINFSEMK